MTVSDLFQGNLESNEPSPGNLLAYGLVVQPPVGVSTSCQLPTVVGQSAIDYAESVYFTCPESRFYSLEASVYVYQFCN